MCSDLSRSYLIWREHLGQTGGCWVSWIAIRLKCLGHVTTDKFQVFSEWRFRGNYSSYTNAYARSASTYIVFPSSPWCYLFISWSVSRSCWWGFLQNGVRFSELTLKCWYCSIYSLRQTALLCRSALDTNVMKTWDQIQKEIRAFDDWNSAFLLRL